MGRQRQADPKSSLTSVAYQPGSGILDPLKYEKGGQARGITQLVKCLLKNLNLILSTRVGGRGLDVVVHSYNPGPGSGADTNGFLGFVGKLT